MWEVRVTPAGDFDNHALEYEHIRVEPLSGAMGAEVVGVRLPELSDAAFEEFKQALYRHKMIYLKDQFLTHAEHEAFGARLGPFAVDVNRIEPLIGARFGFEQAKEAYAHAWGPESFAKTVIEF